MQYDPATGHMIYSPASGHMALGCGCIYRRAYDCFTSVASDFYFLVADIAGEIAKTGGGDTGNPRKCWFPGECFSAIPSGGSLLTGIRGWFQHCGSCTCSFCYAGESSEMGTIYPNKATITVAQGDIEHCTDEFGYRALVQGNASGTWEIPIAQFTDSFGRTYQYGELTVPGPFVKFVHEPPEFARPSAPVHDPPDNPCANGFVLKGDLTCCDEGSVFFSTSNMKVRVFLDAFDEFGVGLGPGGLSCWTEAIMGDGRSAWLFALPGCPTDADSEADIPWTGTDPAHTGDYPKPEAVGTGTFDWAL